MASYVCPTCHQHVEAPSKEDAPYRPFCSARCQLLDLGKWFNEEYRIEAPHAVVADDRNAEHKSSPD